MFNLFQDLIHFWLEKGVDGFRMDAVKHVLEADHLRDEPQVDPNKPPVSSGFLLHQIGSWIHIDGPVVTSVYLLFKHNIS